MQDDRGRPPGSGLSGTGTAARTTLEEQVFAQPEIFRATVQWTVPGASGEIQLDPSHRGPLLVPVNAHGASLATALVEALDRAARFRRTRIVVSRGEAEIVLIRNAEWTSPHRSPSEILAGQASADAPSWTAAAPRNRIMEQARQAIGSEGLAALREYPRRRRGLAAYRRRLEQRFFQMDEQIKSRRRKGMAFAWSAALGFCLTIGGVFLRHAGFAASGAMIFFLAAAGVMLEATGRGEIERRLAVVRSWVARVVRKEERLDDQALELTHRLGAEDPWQLAEQLALAEPEDRQEPIGDIEQREQKRIARQLAALTGDDPEGLEDEGIWCAPRYCATVAWPPDVAEAEDLTGRPTALVGLARLLFRVERNLPAPWPLVLWEPWSGARSEIRARRLMALSRMAEGHPVLAFVRG